MRCPYGAEVAPNTYRGCRLTIGHEGACEPAEVRPAPFQTWRDYLPFFKRRRA